MARLVDTGHHAGNKDDGFGLDVPIVETNQSLLDHFTELGRNGTVAEYTVFYTGPQRADNSLRRDEVHIGHPERKHVLVVPAPLLTIAGPAVDYLIEIAGH
jgi:hypothetical protein